VAPPFRDRTETPVPSRNDRERTEARTRSGSTALTARVKPCLPFTRQTPPRSSCAFRPRCLKACTIGRPATTSRARERSECSSTADSPTSGFRRLKSPARRPAEAELAPRKRGHRSTRSHSPWQMPCYGVEMPPVTTFFDRICARRSGTPAPLITLFLSRTRRRRTP
jgi:hypothetical protein